MQSVYSTAPSEWAGKDLEYANCVLYVGFFFKFHKIDEVNKIILKTNHFFYLWEPFLGL